MKELIDIRKKKECLQNLMIKGCPLGDDFTNSKCPVKKIGTLSANKLGHYVNKLSEEQVNRIYDYHEDCSSFFSC